MTKDGKRGYLPKRDSAVVQPIFATANLAIRKQALDELGFFDTRCKTGEDVDLSVRLSKTRWEMYFEPRAVIRHKHRTTLKGLLKQWYKYGRFHPYIFRKHNPKGLRIYYFTPDRDAGWSSLCLSRIFNRPFPFYILIFITPFHMFNLLSMAFMLSMFLKLYWLAALSFLIWFYFAKKIFYRKQTSEKNISRLTYALIRYVLNWTYIVGAFVGGLITGVFYIEATREEIPIIG